MKILTVIFSLFSVLAFAQTDSLSQQIDCEKVFTIVEEMPEYPGGTDALIAAVNEIVRRAPCKASGAKSLGFDISREGKMKSPIFQPGNLSACSVILEKEFEELETWLPGKQAGKPVCVHFSISVK